VSSSLDRKTKLLVVALIIFVVLLVSVISLYSFQAKGVDNATSKYNVLTQEEIISSIDTLEDKIGNLSNAFTESP